MFTLTGIRTTAQRAVLAALMLAGALSLAHAQDAAHLRIVPNALLSIDQNRSTVVDRIVGEWGEALATSNAGISADELRATLSGMRSDYLLAASIAGSLEGLRNVLASSLIGSAPVMTSKVNPKSIGDAGDDLVYTPVVPCRIVDTRNVGGPFAGGGETRNYHAFVGGGNFFGQGGTPSNCGIPSNPGAAALSIAVVGGAGFLTAWQYGTAQPNASTLNPNGGIVATGAIVPLCQPNCPFEFSIFTLGAQVIVDIVGYFSSPIATALQCTQVSSAATPIPVSSDTLVALPSCAAGYARTGSQCAGTSGLQNAYLIETNASGCLFRNLSSVATYSGTATSTCCRVPGR